MNTKKSRNNIFTKEILPLNIFETQNNKEYKIGGLKIQTGWLANQPPLLYKPHIKSSFQLTELIEKYETLQEQQRTSNNPADTFKMAQLKYRIQNFQVRQESPRKQQKLSALKSEQYELLLQKIGDFWGSSYTRKCVLKDKTLTVQSEKQKEKKIINTENYTFEYEEKEKAKQNEKTYSQESKKFEWVQNKNMRLLIHGQNLRSYCLYGNERDIKSIIKKLQIKGVEKKKLDFFTSLNKQFHQKIITLFGSHLRIYENSYKERRNINNTNTVLSNMYANTPKGDVHKGQTLYIPPSHDQNSNLLSISQISLIQQKEEKGSSELAKSNKKSQIETPNRSPNRSLVQDSMFKLRGRRSTIHYDELQKQTEVFYSPDYKVADINLQIQEVALSEQDIHSNNFRSQSQDEDDQVVYQLPRVNTVRTQRYMSSQIILDEQNQSEESQAFIKAKNKKSHEIQKEKYIYEEREKSMYMYCMYYEQFIPFIMPQISFQVIQLLPQYEMHSQNGKMVVVMSEEQENMKKRICFKEKMNFQKLKTHKERYYNKSKEFYKIYSGSQNFILLFNNEVSQYQYHFAFQNFKNVKYQTDSSIFVNIKDKKTQKTKVCGKLKIILSPSPIDIQKIQERQSENTISFLLSYIWSNSPNFQQKYSLIDGKKKNYLIRKEWSQIMIKKLINKSYGQIEENSQFHKAVFFGLPKSVFLKIKKVVESDTSKKIDIHKLMELTPHYISVLQNQIAAKKVYDVRVLIPMGELIKLIISMPKNYYITERLHQLAIFFRFKFGTVFLSRFLMAFVKQILLKTSPLLLKAKSSKEIKIILAQYFSIEYEIDEIFTKISGYFN